MTLAAGTRLGPYEILGPLGAGGMGEVYRARDTKLGREVAVKVLPEELASDRDRLARFEREARLLASLNHPNIVTIHSIGREEDKTFLAMEMVAGKPLSDLIPSNGFPLERFFELAIPLADALSAAHGQSIVHRDLKPDNIMVDRAGQVKVLDFGLARHASRKQAAPVESSMPTQAQVARTLTRPGVVMGTFPYMAPEQARGEKVDARADVFSLGAVLYEMACGRRPFRGKTPTEILTAVLRDTPPLLTDLRPALPPQIAWVVRRCLEKDPERRIQTSKDVRNELQDLKEQSRDTSKTEDDQAISSLETKPAERTFTLTTGLLRQLSEPSPRLIGRSMTYLDNELGSQTLVVLVHGLGADQRQFERALREIPARAVAPTLVGFEPEADWRPALGIADHSRLLRGFIQDLASRLRPKYLVLAGFSSGADQCLRLVSSEEGVGLEIAGLVALGPNIDLATCFFTSRLAQLSPEEPDEILGVLKSFGQDLTSLADWLTVQQYILTAFSKLAKNLEVLRRYAADIVAPFEEGGDPLARWFRRASKTISRVQMVFGNGSEADSAEALLSRHLANNILGNRFTESSCLLEPVHHMDLADPEVVVRHVREAVEAIQDG